MPHPATAFPFNNDSMRLRPTTLLALASAFLDLTSLARTAHSDIILSRTNGVLQVNNAIHTGNVRENNAAGTGFAFQNDQPPSDKSANSVRFTQLK